MSTKNEPEAALEADESAEVEEIEVDATESEEEDTEVVVEADSDSRQVSTFVDDDESFLNAEDKALSLDFEEAVIQQQRGLVFWQIEGLFDEDGKMLNKLALRQSPPKLIIRTTTDEGEEMVEMLITKDMARAMSKHFDMIDKGYYGIKPPSEMSMGERATGFLAWMKAHPAKALICGLAAFAVLFAIVSPLFQQA